MTNKTNTPNQRKSLPSVQARQGSAILIVVGTLALIAVFAAIYISIGQSDQRVARSVKNRAKITADTNTIANYITGILRDDRLGTYTQRADSGGNIFAVRENTDAPYIDWTTRSESVNIYERFNPAGNHSPLGPQPPAATDYRVPSDPWLASTTPTFLGDPGQPTTGTDSRPFGTLLTQTALDPDDFIGGAYSSGFLDKRDWLQISNLAPDGRFVNLFNLRAGTAQSNGFGDGNFGGFDSEPGTGTFIRPSDGRTVRRMSQYLSLWNQETPGDPNSRLVAFDPASDGIWLPGRNAPESNHGILDVTNTPAVWTMYQRFSFLPLNQPFMTVNRNGQISTWADPDYAPYQWADADGDGMADSRWFELASAQDTQSGSPTPRTDIQRLYDAGQNRIFVAARVVDLSSMVNVNTAMDQLTEPTPATGGVLGATPADVDLRRFLSIADPGQNYTILQLAGLSPSNFHKPVLTNNNDLLDPDYKWYRSYKDSTSVAPRLKIEPSSNALSIGRYAYTAIKRSIEDGQILDDRYYAWPAELRAQNSDTGPTAPATSDFNDNFNPPTANFDPASPDRLAQFHKDPIDSGIGSPMTALQRAQWYLNIGRLDPFAIQQVNNLQNYPAAGTLYDQDDLYELLAFHGLNDPDSLSRLEKAAMGRMPSIFGQNQRAFSPLLSNRPLALDRERHGFVDQSDYAIAAPGEPREITGAIAKESMAFFSVTPRKLLTTVSGSSTILPGTVIQDTNTNLTFDPNELRLLPNQAAPSFTNALQSPESLFQIYSRALAGELNPIKLANNLNQAFVLDPTDARTGAAASTATLFYGHRGPELALRIAAHAAVNMKDLYDTDNDPTPATIILDDSIRSNFNGTMNNNDPDYLHYAGRASGNLFDPGGAVTPNNRFTGEQAGRKAVNVFGIEPMPFLTEVSSMYVYMDSASGDIDYNTTSFPLPGRPGFGGPIIPLDSENVEVTIDGTVSATNADLMLQLIAFQLTNPWDVPLIIGGTNAANEPMGHIDNQSNSPTNTNLKFDYYIEFGGRFFKLGEFIEYNELGDLSDPNAPPPNTPITSDPVFRAYQYRSTSIPPNSSRVFYAIAHARFDDEGVAPGTGLDAKWLSEIGSFTDDDGQSWTGPAEEWVNQQFRVRGSATPVHIHQFDPRTGDLVEQEEFNNLLLSPTDPIFESSDRTHDFTQARLWRKIVGNLEESTGSPLPLGAIQDNKIQNDLLVDRLGAEMPSGDPLFFDRKLAAGSNVIDGSVGYDPDLYTQADVNATGVRNDNFGLSIVRWASARRGDNEATARNSSFGQVNAWMLSSRSNPTFNTLLGTDPTNERTILTIADFLDGSVEDLDRPYPIAFAKPDYEVHDTFIDLLNLNPFQEVIQTIARKAKDKYRVATGMQPTNLDLAAKFPELPLGANASSQTLHATGSPLRPEILPNANEFNDAPRLADLLLAWGIGPTYIPDPTRTAADISFDANDEARRWMTLPEALAIATGYEVITPADYDPNEPDAENIWIDSFSATEQLFDNGHLSLNNYVSYYNTDTSEIVPDFDTLTDIRRGTGIPMALGVLDQTRAIAPFSGTTDLQELLTTPTFGQININTAPVEVLRLLPGLSPNLTDYYPGTSATTASEWWGLNGPWNLPNLTEPYNVGAAENRTPDVAAMLVAYRDRIPANPRFSSRNTEFVAEGNPLRFTSANVSASQHAFNLMGEQTADELSQTDDHRDRATISGIDGLRPTPGFSSLGEILAVTIDPGATGAGIGGAAVPLSLYNNQLDIQQYARDNLNLDGISDDEVAIDPQLFSGITNGSTIDDYAERLAMADAIVNTLTVRSDYYAVWFVIHAYQESDVTNLQPEDPLIPSLAKRYVMVVDRTNVTDPGDTPKIVFLKEVPM